MQMYEKIQQGQTLLIKVTLLYEAHILLSDAIRTRTLIGGFLPHIYIIAHFFIKIHRQIVQKLIFFKLFQPLAAFSPTASRKIRPTASLLCQVVLV